MEPDTEPDETVCGLVEFVLPGAGGRNVAELAVDPGAGALRLLREFGEVTPPELSCGKPPGAPKFGCELADASGGGAVKLFRPFVAPRFSCGNPPVGNDPGNVGSANAP